MNTQYVIVLEVDNHRAQAAYAKGLHDLDAAWPQIMQYAKEKDRIADEALAVMAASYEANKKRDAEQFERDREVRRRYQEWWNSTSFFKGPMPPEPSSMSMTARQSHHMVYLETLMRHHTDSRVRHYERIRKHLQDRVALAGAAVSPFKMTEQDVLAMIAWEDGTRIEEIKKEVA